MVELIGCAWISPGTYLFFWDPQVTVGAGNDSLLPTEQAHMIIIKKSQQTEMQPDFAWGKLS